MSIKSERELTQLQAIGRIVRKALDTSPAGEGKAGLQADHWTVVTDDRSLSAHYEHTIVITRGSPILLTA